MKPMLDNSKTNLASAWIWVGLVAAVSVALSMKLQCAVPFAALGAIAALHLRRGEGLALVGLAWAINQGLGYTVLGYPHDADSYAWGATMGLAAVAGFVTAELARLAIRGQGYAVAAVASLVAAFAGYQAILFAARIWLPATDFAFSAPIVAQIGLVNVVAFAALVAVHYGLTSTGLLARKAA
jgi:hypothetical protein